MLIFALRRWRMMLVLGIVLGVLAGTGYLYKGLSSWDSDITAYESVAADYNAAVETYEQQKAQLQTEIETLMKSVEEQETYLEESVLMNMDAHNKMHASVDIVVRVDEDVLSANGNNSNYDPTDSLLSLYTNSIRKTSDWDKISEISGVKTEYVKELVSTWANNDGNIVSVSVSHPDKKVATQMLEEILTEMLGRHDEMAAVVGGHTLSPMKISAGIINDTDLLNQQTQAKDVLVTYNQKIADKQSAIDSLIAPEAISMSQPSKKNLLVKAILYAVIGFVAGICVIGALYCAIFIFDGKIHSEDELKDLNLVRSLGMFPRSEEKRAFAIVDRWLDKMSGLDSTMTTEQMKQLVALNIQNYAEGAKALLVTGSVGEDELNKIHAILSEQLPDKQIDVGADVQKNVESYKAAMDCEALVFVEKIGVSKYEAVVSEKIFADSLGKKVVGCILV